MKKIIKYAILLMNIVNMSFSYWYINDVYFSVSNTGYLVGDYGLIARTTNGGVQWIQQASNTPFSLRRVFFIDANTGIVVGGSNLGDTSCILRTTNGGINWNQQINGFNSILNSVFFMDINTGVLVGGRGLIARTTNGGINWEQQSSSITNYLYDVCFTDPNTVIAVGNNIILRSTNGGINWSSQSGFFVFYSVSFADINNGLTTGVNISYRTTNGGINWIYQSYSPLLRAVCFINASTATMAGSEGVILRSTNGGLNWYQQVTGLDIILMDISFTDINNGYAVGEQGTILKTTNGGVNWVSQWLLGVNISSTEIPDNFSLGQNYPNPFNPATKIKFDVPSNVKRETSNVKLVIYDLLGREVTTLVNEELKPGTYEADWDASNYSSGVYFYKLVSGDFSEIKKMVLMK